MKAILYIAAMIACLPLQARDKPDSSGQPVAGKFIFSPEMVYPLSLRPRPVTADFELRIQPDSIICYLPYFGRAYSADYHSSRGVTDFISTSFRLEQDSASERSEIRVYPRDNREVREIRLTYYHKEPYADVHIIFNQRQAITYRGKLAITPLKDR